MFRSANSILKIVIGLYLSFSLVACDSNGQVEAKIKPIPIINDTNINQFTQTLHNDYVAIQKDLLNAFYRYQKSADSHGFVQFRNYEWTPTYIEKKNYYQMILNKNRSYLTRQALNPAFISFENLIYIGLSLKNGLLNDDQQMIKTTLAEAKADKKQVAFILR